MRPLNNKGMALITALMMTMIILVIIMGIMYVVTQSSKMSSAQKVYRNVTEATYGGADIAMQVVIPQLFQNMTSTTLTTLKSTYSTIGMQTSASACLQQKMKTPTSKWTTCPAITTINPKVSPDLTFKLTGTMNQDFNIYAKIVDTVQGVAFTPGTTGGNILIGSSVAESSAGATIALQHYIYTIEVAGESSKNPAVKSSISVLYEY
jgi:hypothetical protein